MTEPLAPTAGSALERPDSNRLERRVHRLLAAGHSVPAIAGRLHRERDTADLAALVAVINRVKHEATEGGA